MMKASEVRDWLDDLPMDAHVGIDDGGLLLCYAEYPDTTYLEIGGLPDPEDHG
jgi:hypothetical protein